MGASDDEEGYITYGQPLGEEQLSVAGQHKKDVKDPALTKALPVWQQEATDVEGRRRFHGAFTGGYSAGFFNTVGSKEGWAPATFKSSREQRAGSRQQTAEDFMDEDELEELGQHSLQTKAEFDTFGHDAAGKARAAAAAAQQERPGLPSIIPDELIAPVPDSIGIRLLQKMGWRQGKGVGSAVASSAAQPGSRWGAMASVGAENVKVHVLPPKNDTHGLGFDPFKGAEDFRAAKRGRDQPEPRVPAAKRTRGVAFGTGVMDEDDVFGLADDYVIDPESKEALDFELHSDEDTEPAPRQSGVERTYLLPGRAEPLRLQTKENAQQQHSLVPGFVRAEQIEHVQQFPSPKVPPEYEPMHHFPPETDAGREAVGREPRAPSADLLRAIRTLAPFVARMGPAFEALALQKNAGNPVFSFLYGGEGADYYRWQVRALKAAARDATGLVIGQRSKPLTAGDRGVLLGEAALPHSSAAADAAGQTLSQAAAPAIADGDRQALQETLQSTFARGRRQDMGYAGAADASTHGLRLGSAAAAAAAANPAAQQVLQAAASKFASSGTFEGGEQQAGGLAKPAPPPQPPPQVKPAAGIRRTVEEWRPAPLLCKRFNVPDPFQGRAAPAPETSRFKTDALALPETAAAAAAPISHQAPFAQQRSQPPGTAQPPLPPAQALPPPPPEQQLPPPPARPASPPPLLPAALPAAPVDSANAFLDSLLAGTTTGNSAPAGPVLAAPKVEKPIDLFKAIFEDDSGDEDEEADEELASAGGKSVQGLAAPPSADNQPRSAMRGAIAPPAAHAERPLSQPAPPQQDTMQHRQPTPLDARKPDSDTRQQGRVESNGTQDEAPAAQPSRQAADTNGSTARPNTDGAEIQEALAVLAKAKKKDKKKREKDKEKNKKGHKKSKKSSKSKKDRVKGEPPDSSDSEEA